MPGVDVGEFVFVHIDHGSPDEGPGKGHEEGSGNTFVSNIRNEETQSLICEFKHIVEIAAYLAGSLPARGEFPILKLRQGFWNKRLLDLARQLYLGLEAFAHHHFFLQ